MENMKSKPFYTQSAKLSREILEEIQILEESIVEGKKVVDAGVHMAVEARKKLPQLPVTISLKNILSACTTWP